VIHHRHHHRRHQQRRRAAIKAVWLSNVRTTL
jgi:hypothetical protein